MIHYKDRTFCNSVLCSNEECPRKLTDAILEDAQDFGLSVSSADFSSGCMDFIPVEVYYEY